MVTVRRARPEDAAEVAGVHVRSWQAGYRGILSAEYLDALRPEDRMGRYRFGDTDPQVPSTLVAEENGTIVGFVTTGPSPDTAGWGEVFALYVDPVAWGSGVGRRLLADGRRQLEEGAFTDAVLWVLVGNDRAERFYRADGWWADGIRRTVEIWDITADEIRYRHLLG
jgi:GNAT superfamily N-acetyltransferase